MAETGNTVETRFSAQTGELTAALGHVKEQISQASEGIKGAFEGISKGMFAITAMIAGGAAFKEFVAATVEMSTAATSMASKLGISAGEADLLSGSLKRIGISSEAYVGMAMKMNRQLRTNEEGLRALGLETRNVDGSLKNQAALMEEGARVLGEYKGGTDRNIVAQTLFGRGTEEATKLLRMNNEVKAAAKKADEELGLSITDNVIAANRAYKRALVEVGDVMEGIQKQIGDVLVPRLTAMALWFREIGPAAVITMQKAMELYIDVVETLKEVVISLVSTVTDGFKTIANAVGVTFGDGSSSMSALQFAKNVILTLQIIVFALGMAFEMAFEEIKLAIEAFTAHIMRAAKVWYSAMKLDFSGAVAAWQEGAQKIESIVDKSSEKLAAIRDKYAAKLDRATVSSMTGLKQGEESPYKEKGWKDAPGDSKKAEAIAAARLARDKALEEQRLAVLREKFAQEAALNEEMYKIGVRSTEKYYEEKLRIELAGIEASLTAKRNERAEAEKLMRGTADEAKRIGYETQVINYTKEITVLEMKLGEARRKNADDYTSALEKQKIAMADILRQQQESAALSAVENARAGIEMQKALRLTSNADAIRENMALEAKAFSARRARLDAERAATIANTTITQDERIRKIQETDSKIEKLEADHQKTMLGLEKDAAVEAAKYQLQIQSSFESSFGSLVEDIINHTKTMKQAFMDFANSVVASLNKIAAQKMAENLFGAGTGGNDWIGKIFGGNWGGTAAGAVTPLANRLVAPGESAGGGGGIFSAIGSWFSKFVGSFDIGTPYVPQDMLAVVHQGERVIPAADNMSGNYGGVNVTNHFKIAGTADVRTQQQIALAAGMGVQRAMRRNG